jgi:ribosome-binding protein aMBF1 (putative translation factor)
MEIEATMEQAGLSKVELARRMGADASVVRRIFSSPNSNPTFRTVLDMLSALDLSIEIRPSNPADPQTQKKRPMFQDKEKETDPSKPPTHGQEAA